MWSPRDPVFATWDRNTIELTAANAAGHYSLAGSAPAFKRDGTFTHVRNGEVLEWTSDCGKAAETLSPPVPLGADPFGPYCPQRVIARSELVRPLPRGARLRSVEALAWLDDSRFMAVLATRERAWVAAYEGGRALRASPYATGADITRADPTGSYVAILARGTVEAYDRDTGIPWGSPLEAVAYDWSPVGDWLAYSTGASIYLVRTSDWTTQFRLPLSTVSLAWRQ